MIGNYKFSILIIWNLLWGGFAIDQLGMTYELVNQENNIYGDKIVVEENGVKFLRSKKESDNDAIEFKDHKCTDEKFWRESFQTTEWDLSNKATIVQNDPEAIEIWFRFDRRHGKLISHVVERI